VDKQVLLHKNIWEGDKIFLKLLDQRVPFFSLKLVYEGETLVRAILNGKTELV
jgi:8-oxo-dGTP diphosphatase